MTGGSDRRSREGYGARRYLALGAELLGLSYRRAPGLTLALFAVQAVSVVAVAASALGLRAAVNASADGHESAAVLGAIGAAAAYAVIAVIADLGDNIRGLIIDQVGVLDLGPRILGQVAALDGVEHLERTDFLDRIAIVSGGSWGIANGFWSAVEAVFGVAQLGVALLLLGTVSPWLLLLLGFAAAPLWFDQRGQRTATRAETDTAEQFRLQQHLFDLATAPGSGKELRVAGAGPELARRQALAWENTVHGRYRAALAAAAWQIGGWAVFCVGFTAGLAVIVYRAAHGRGSAGDVVLAVTVAVTLRQSVQATVGRTAATAASRRLAEPYLWLRDYVAAQCDRPGGEPAPARLRTGIALDRLSYTYPGTDRPALDGISVLLPAGSVVALVGEYGSGKTTLVKLLAKFYRPDHGAILVDGADLAGLDTAGWRAVASAAFQDFGRYRTVLAETIGLGDPPRLEDRGRIGLAVRAADADAFVARLPQGLDTQLGRALGGVDLSEGQWQKTALARASMRSEPLLFMLDEPTASLDAPSEREIFERYMVRARALAVRTGAITVVVSHRFSTVTRADLILVLDKGRLVESGSHADLLALGGRYADLYGLQAVAYAGP